MNRADFVALRDLPGKTISGSIRLLRKQASRPLLVADRIPINNSDNAPLLMNINYNPETGLKTINVSVAGEGAICRLDVDGSNHGDAGRSHKHAVKDDKSIQRQLREDVTPRPELSGWSLQEVFKEFCSAANIDFVGDFEAPDEEDSHA